VAVASYTSLHLAPDRQPRQQPTTQFITDQMPFLPPNRERQSTEGNKHNAIPAHGILHIFLTLPLYKQMHAFAAFFYILFSQASFKNL